MIRLFILSVFLLCSCSSKEDEKKSYKKEPITRSCDDKYFNQNDLVLNEMSSYPWETKEIKRLPRITNEYFKCKGSSIHMPRMILNGSDQLVDCSGPSSHLLSIVHNEEKVYPVLIDILNYLQNSLKKRVIITCGHRCLSHNKYADLHNNQKASKHTIGAEVDFYIKDLEEKPMEVINHIFEFYKNTTGYKNKQEYEEFLRDENNHSVSVNPWFNKEIYIKMYNKNEGRDFDNRHPYPYISIQVRYDRDLKEKVEFSYEKASLCEKN